MVAETHPSWMRPTDSKSSRVDFDEKVLISNSSSSSSKAMLAEDRQEHSPYSFPSQNENHSATFSDFNLGFGERVFSAAGAAVISAILVNPLDVVKTRLQAQAAGVPYSHQHYHIHSRTRSIGPYKGTLDVFSKIVRQEGFIRLWRGTNAALALAIPTVGIYLPCYDIFRNRIQALTADHAPHLTPYAPLVAGAVARSLACISCYPIELARTRMQASKELKNGVKPPGVWKTLLGVLNPVSRTYSLHNLQGYRLLWTGVGAQVARDVPFSAICWSTLEPMRRRILGLVGEENGTIVLGANFSAGFIAGSLAAAATCPLDVAKTRRQIEKDLVRQLNMTTRQTVMEVWRDGGVKGLFMGVGPRVARAGPSVGIVVSFYEVVKYVLHQRHTSPRV
ncbi:mitochondrial carrier protein MTM1-like isoform X1 [Papaver somniferum]|uniref:mitochondrial carrier protein MTM1-like isoform X1 n=1 Tax=Papaver somniferum TaxID=3469 RepID=UPI000E6FB420|nr:mitochondrial carrier protein MTM1-like isoform X1 [Papaver somniferum]